MDDIVVLGKGKRVHIAQSMARLLLKKIKNCSIAPDEIMKGLTPRRVYRYI